MQIPPPRTDLAVHPNGDGVLLGDTVAGQQTALGPQSTGVWMALRDGHCTPAALEAALPDLPRAVLRARIGQLAHACVLDDARWQVQRLLFRGPRAAPAAAGAPLRQPAALRHQCVRCGSSCTGVAVGPIGPATEAVLAPDQLRPAGAHQLMARAAEACVVYAPEAGCGIERAHGRAAKPDPCRQFPLTLTQGPDVVRVGLSAECRRLLACLAAGAQGDPPGAAAQAELAALAQRPGVAVPLPDPVQLAPGLFVPLAEFLPHFEGLGVALPGLRAGLATWLDGVRLALPDLPWLAAAPWGDPPAPVADRAEAALWRAITAAAAEGAEDAATAGQGWEAERSALVARAASHLAGDAPLPPIRPLEPDADAALEAAVVHGALAGLEPVQRRDVLWGVGRVQLLTVLGRAVAQVRAARVARAFTTPQDLNDGLVVASLTLRSPRVEQALGEHAATVRWRYAAPAGPWRPLYGFLP